jgi:uncharacterized membrane protein YecN with MAPEG domain
MKSRLTNKQKNTLVITSSVVYLLVSLACLVYSIYNSTLSELILFLVSISWAVLLTLIASEYKGFKTWLLWIVCAILFSEVWFDIGWWRVVFLILTIVLIYLQVQVW